MRRICCLDCFFTVSDGVLRFDSTRGVTTGVCLTSSTNVFDVGSAGVISCDAAGVSSGTPVGDGATVGVGVGSGCLQVNTTLPSSG